MIRQKLCIYLACILLTACGGGGGGGAATPAQLSSAQIDEFIAELNGKRIENVGRLDTVSN